MTAFSFAVVALTTLSSGLMPTTSPSERPAMHS